MRETSKEAHGGLRGLAAPHRDDVGWSICVGLCGQRGSELLDALALLIQHVGDVDFTDVGDDQLQQQFAAQIAKVGDGRVQPPSQLGATGACCGQDRAISSGDAGLFADGMDVFACGQLIQ